MLPKSALQEAQAKPVQCLLPTAEVNDLVSCFCLCVLFGKDKDFSSLCWPALRGVQYTLPGSSGTGESWEFRKAPLAATQKEYPNTSKLGTNPLSILFFFQACLVLALFTEYIWFIKERSLLSGMTSTEALATLHCYRKKTEISETIILLSATPNDYEVVGLHYIAGERRKMASIILMSSTHIFCEAAIKALEKAP